VPGRESPVYITMPVPCLVRKKVGKVGVIAGLLEKVKERTLKRDGGAPNLHLGFQAINKRLKKGERGARKKLEDC